MAYIPASLRQTVIQRAGNRCEYCQLSQEGQVATFHEVPIFNPRRQIWTDHFRWDDVHIVGLTAIERAVVAALDMNRPIVLAIRAEEVYFDRHPPV